MTTLTPPRANIPIGWAMVGGQRVAVAIEPEWLRYLAGSLFDRGGGTTGSGTNDLETAQFDDAGIDDLKVTVSRLADEAARPIEVAPVIVDGYDQVAALMAEVDALKARIEAIEQA